PVALRGAGAGVGGSINYNGGIMLGAVVAASIASRVPWRERGRRIALFVAWLAAAFVIGTPFSLLDHGPFVEGLIRQSRHIATPHGLDLGPGGMYHLAFSLRYGVGLPLLAAGLFGFVWLFRSDWRRGALLVTFPAAYY